LQNVGHRQHKGCRDIEVIVDDGLPQPNADRPPAQLACLFDKRTDAVDIKPLSR
jgi:hypothetical protein